MSLTSVLVHKVTITRCYPCIVQQQMPYMAILHMSELFPSPTSRRITLDPASDLDAGICIDSDLKSTEKLRAGEVEVYRLQMQSAGNMFQIDEPREFG